MAIQKIGTQCVSIKLFEITAPNSDKALDPMILEKTIIHKAYLRETEKILAAINQCIHWKLAPPIAL